MLCSDLTIRVLLVSDCAAGSGQQAGETDQRRREVFPLRVRGLWEALHHCPPPQGEHNHLSYRKTMIDTFHTWPSFRHLTLNVLSCRFTSARTPETNRTSVSFPPAGRSLLQVPARNLLPAIKSNLFTVNMGSEIKLISWLSISVRLMLRVESFTPCLCHLVLVPR